ncbi:unnamed protein product [Chondrus crispus]|uniref:Uncharacterized protein n=1 Tax=Chondrus crispus TaxID=2769 RepID=R7QQ67_CHOCR|nr:unnamed protein product [Chondrus crispus]CDF39505.1 unnamed protein product [Chondrus crispus]|eukprot:XP_005719416.1 unnamed protein product [Chondrus crispus]
MSIAKQKLKTPSSVSLPRGLTNCRDSARNNYSIYEEG